jgi:hypothetical protein
VLKIDGPSLCCLAFSVGCFLVDSLFCWICCARVVAFWVILDVDVVFVGDWTTDEADGGVEFTLLSIFFLSLRFWSYELTGKLFRSIL